MGTHITEISTLFLLLIHIYPLYHSNTFMWGKIIYHCLTYSTGPLFSPINKILKLDHFTILTYTVLLLNEIRLYNFPCFKFIIYRFCSKIFNLYNHVEHAKFSTTIIFIAWIKIELQFASIFILLIKYHSCWFNSSEISLCIFSLFVSSGVYWNKQW